MAIVKLEQIFQPPHVALEEKLKEMETSVSVLEVNDQKSFRDMSKIYSDLRTLEKKVEEAKKSASEKYKKAIELINFTAKRFQSRIDHAIEICNAKAIALESEMITGRDMIESIFGVEEAQIYLESEFASLITSQTLDITAEDLSKVPEKYLKLDEAAIKKDYKMGMEIPGVKITTIKSKNLRKK